MLQIAVVPFVALAIGIDDTYVILGAWHHTDLKANYRQRMADTLRECGTAITVGGKQIFVVRERPLRSRR